MKKYFIAMFAGALGMLPATSQGAVLTKTMSDLLAPGAFIDSGDKRFSDFKYTSTGDMPLANAVNVTPINIAGNYGLEFHGGFVDTFSSPGASDALITYTVTVLDPTKFITDAHIQGNPDVIGPAGKSGLMAVTDSFVPDFSGGCLPGPGCQMTIFDTTPPHSVQNVDNVLFPHGVKVLHAQKDIFALALNDLTTATLSVIDQTYSQSVPEPATLALLGVGALALVRRRKKA